MKAATVCCILCWSFLSAAWLGGAGVATAADSVPLERIVYRDLLGTVVDDENGKPMAGVIVSLLYETTVTDAAGKFVFEKVPLKHAAAISVRVRNSMGYIIGCMTLDVPAGFYPLAAAEGDKVAIQIVEMADDTPVELRIKRVPSQQINQYCQVCHRSNPCVETVTYSRVTQSGADLRGIVVDEKDVENFRAELVAKGLREETYAQIRYQDTHPKGVDLPAVILDSPDRYRLPDGLTGMTEDQEVTCDTCHSRHLPTEERQYVVLPFEDESNTLCTQCHL